MRARGEAKSAARIALQRIGAGKKEKRPSRLAMPLLSTGGVGRGAKYLTVRQLAMSPAGGMVTWMEQGAAWWLTTTGKAEGPFPTRHPTLSVERRRIPLRLLGLWRMVTSLVLLAMRRKLYAWLSHVIFTSGLGFTLKSIVPVKPAMFWLLDLFTVVSKLKRAFQEAWRVMVLFISMKCYGCGWLRLRQ
jgi:hypothetical protein